MSAVLVACGGGSASDAPGKQAQSAGGSGSESMVAGPSVTALSPTDLSVNVQSSTQNANNVVTGTLASARFSTAMDPSSLNSTPAAPQATFTVTELTIAGLPGAGVDGSVAMNSTNTVAVFTPSGAALKPSTTYRATVSAAARSAGNSPLGRAVTWTFTTGVQPFSRQAPVDLGAAETFAVLTKTGVTNVFASQINGDVGASPITGAAVLVTCDEVQTGTVYTVDAAGPLPCAVTNASLLNSAIGDMETAYTDAAGRNLPDHTELGDGEIGGLTLAPGLYKWGTGVLISTDVTLSGGPNDVWIFQIAGTLTQASAARVNLTGGALAKNVFWQSADAVSLGTTSHFQGVLLAKTMVAVKTEASVNGRLLAQTAVTLQKSAVTQPTP
jgi:hypothetical protein